jgi:methionyl-tRNA formyltransferase
MSTPLIAIGRSRYLYDAIRHLLSKGYSFKAIVTEEAYEEYDVTHTDFQELALGCAAAFLMIKSLDNEQLRQIIKDNGVRLGISANWKYIVPKTFLDLFDYGILNFHLGNLPDYKGNATVNWTIINGETYINGNIHKMEPELDAGDVVARKAIPIRPDTYIADILKQAATDAPLLYEEGIRRVLNDPGTYEVKGTVRGLRCYPRLPEDSQISWNQSAENIGRLIRASSRPYKGAFSFLNNERITIWKATPVFPEDDFLAIPGHVVALNRADGTVMVACRDGLIELQEIERNGEVMPPMTLIKSIRARFK